MLRVENFLCCIPLEGFGKFVAAIHSIVYILIVVGFIQAAFASSIAWGKSKFSDQAI